MDWEDEMKNLLSGVASIALLSCFTLGQAFAQTDAEAVAEDESERMVVTGSLIERNVEDAAVPVQVFGRSDLDEIGSPTLNEFLRNVPAAQGLIGETNQFDVRGGQGHEGITTINLRGLGSARTLVLLNDRRHVGADDIGVDVQMIPLIAVDRVEILLDGAAALYGSDAIGGVVNFITRDNFEGFEVRGNYQLVEESDGNDWDVGGIYGRSGELWGKNYTFMIAAEYARRGELMLRDAGFVRPIEDNPQGGYSSIGNPGTFWSSFEPAPGVIAPLAPNPDPNCDALGGVNNAGFCRFQFLFFDNLVEETETIRVMTRSRFEIAENHEMTLEGLFHRTDLPEWKTSPAYPPQTLLAPSNFVLPDHPGRIAFFEQNPEYAARFDPDLPVYFWGRYQGVTGDEGIDGNPNLGEPEYSQRLTEQYRGAITFKGSLFDDRLDYTIAGTYSIRNRELNDFADMRVERFALALRGLGGPGCDPNTGTPGVGPCEYYNPFSNSIERSVVTGQANPNFDPSVANSPELRNWLVDRGNSLEQNRLATLDVAFSGELPISLPGGDVGFAIGGQLRKEFFRFEVSDNFNLDKNPCAFTQPISVELGLTPDLDCVARDATTGLFAFLAPAVEQKLERNVFGFFGELAVPIFENLDMQLAIRYEDYGDTVGSTLDPKLALRWQALDWLALRGSVSTTFRGPPLSFLGGRATTLAFTSATTAFKAWDTVGNPDLKPESAFASNVGVLVNTEKFTASIDYWRFDFTDPFQLEDGNQIASAYTNFGCQDGGVGVGTPTCNTLRERIFPLGVPANQLERIERFWINGSDIVTDGIDFFAEYTHPVGEVVLSAGVTGTYTLSYESEDFTLRNGVTVAPGGDFVGFLNENTPFQTIVGLRGNAFLTAAWRNHGFRYTLRYVEDYEDQVAPRPDLREIDSFVTHDINYNLDLFDGNTRLSFSVFNIADKEPPLVAVDLNFDPFTHSPFGRLIKFGVVQKF